MPGDTPEKERSGEGRVHYIELLGGLSGPAGVRAFLRRRAFRASVSAIAISAVSAGPAHALAADFFDFGVLDPTSVFMLAIFCGAMSFALLSAFWLIRERARNVSDYETLKTRFSDQRTHREQLEALIASTGQRFVVWNKNTGRAQVFGQLEGDGIPESAAQFLAFGKWLEPSSAAAIERSVERLRENAEAFTIGIETQKGFALEAAGRVSGSQAHVCFTPVNGISAELGRLQRENTILGERFDLFEKLMNGLDAPFWLKKHDGSLDWVNNAYARAVDAADQASATREGSELFDRNEREAISEAHRNAGQFKGLLPAIVAGDRKMMETAVAGTDAGSAGLAIDRSEVDAVRATLKQAIASHQQTFDHLATAVAIFDSKQRLRFHNSSFQQLWGFTSQQLTGEPSNGEILDAMRDAKMLPATTDWKKWKDGQLSIYHATEARSETWHLPDGRTLRVIVNPQNHGGVSWVFENLTEQLELKSNYNALVRVQGETLDHLSEAVAVFGSNGRVRLTNPVFLNLWGFDSAEGVDGKHIRDLSKICRKSLSDDNLWEQIELGITGVEDGRDDLSGRLEFTDGRIIDFRLVHLPNAQTMLTFADMSAAVNVERALQERNDALEQSDALKTRFIQHVSYELRAPLTSIAGFTEVLMSNAPGELNTKQSEYLGYISQSSGALKSLIDDILDLATIDAGAMELDVTEFGVREILDESLELVADRLHQRGIRSAVDIENGDIRLIADQARLGKALANLLVNAAEASPDGAKISVTASRKGANVRIAVEDQGPGVPEEYTDVIFERFEATRRNAKRGGAGLGLAIVRSFIELHGGTVWHEKPGKRGARFVCEVPVNALATQVAAE